ncbi:Acetyltransferase (isoleucine patch superfamily) [Fodinibius roseus]|uniref:Acetyltransferase (Isoleucine patch superfamily) n=1 Tax=Fodinibius roseus TaxID=1194090 RepID=A0A1M5J346_9BACT|nr:CatB-related O-acetyltransferase [Fodinibius roseus]SHG34962.1 Acetyltransferase (isoleucine patch superfamily) [Fodinibius roseus]
MSLKSLIQKAIGFLASVLSKGNDIQLDAGYELPDFIKMRGATLRGRITIQGGCKIQDGVTIAAGSPVKIGRYTSLNGPSTKIRCEINKVIIGSFCSIARQVSIQEFNHRYDGLTTYHIFKNVFNEGVEKDIESSGAIVIGNDVWIGANASILSGVTLGHGAIIAANSVVTKDVPEYAIVGGIPAKTIKMRFNQSIIDRLLKLKWWDWDIKKIKKNRHLFEEALTLEKIDQIK